MTIEAQDEFTKLKRAVFEAARAYLVATNPQYVDGFQRVLDEAGGDLDRAISETKPLLGDGLRDWSKLLTAFSDFELVLEKMSRSLTYLRQEIVGSPLEQGQWVSYHTDHWTFQMDALLERLDSLVAQAFRLILRPKDRGWRNQENAVRADIQKMKDVTAQVRDPLAHGLGGGISAISSEQLWEPFLAGANFDVDFISDGYVQMGPMRDRWLSFLEQTSAMAIAASEAIFKRVSSTIWERPS